MDKRQDLHQLLPAPRYHVVDGKLFIPLLDAVNVKLNVESSTQQSELSKLFIAILRWRLFLGILLWILR